MPELTKDQLSFIFHDSDFSRVLSVYHYTKPRTSQELETELFNFFEGVTNDQNPMFVTDDNLNDLVDELQANLLWLLAPIPYWSKEKFSILYHEGESILDFTRKSSEEYYISLYSYVLGMTEEEFIDEACTDHLKLGTRLYQRYIELGSSGHFIEEASLQDMIDDLVGDLQLKGR